MYIVVAVSCYLWKIGMDVPSPNGKMEGLSHVCSWSIYFPLADLLTHKHLRNSNLHAWCKSQQGEEGYNFTLSITSFKTIDLEISVAQIDPSILTPPSKPHSNLTSHIPPHPSRRPSRASIRNSNMRTTKANEVR